MPDRTQKIERLAEDFIAYKRSRGYVYGTSTVNTVKALVSFIVERDAGKGPLITEELALEYISVRGEESATTRQLRGVYIRQFALYLHRVGHADVYVLPTMLVPKKSSEFVPYVFSHEQIERLAESFDSLKPRLASDITHIVHPALFRVFYGCGLRLSEATALRACDVDLENGVLRVREAKGREQRFVPMHPSLTSHLEGYVDKMGAYLSDPESFFLPTRTGCRVSNQWVLTKFQKVYTQAGILRSDGTPPRVHDLRTTFAVHALERAERDGVSSSALLPKLAVVMGHRDVKTTEYYLHLTASLGNVAATKFEDWCLEYELEAGWNWEEEL